MVLDSFLKKVIDPPSFHPGVFWKSRVYLVLWWGPQGNQTRWKFLQCTSIIILNQEMRNQNFNSTFLGESVCGGRGWITNLDLLQMPWAKPVDFQKTRGNRGKFKYRWRFQCSESHICFVRDHGLWVWLSLASYTTFFVFTWVNVFVENKSRSSTVYQPPFTCQLFWVCPDRLLGDLLHGCQFAWRWHFFVQLDLVD